MKRRLSKLNFQQGTVIIALTAVIATSSVASQPICVFAKKAVKESVKKETVKPPTNVKIIKTSDSRLNISWKTYLKKEKVDVEIQENDEGPALGGAILAAVGCGRYSDVITAAKSLVKVVETVEPDAELVAKYEEKYNQFKKLYPTLKPVYPLM